MARKTTRKPLRFVCLEDRTAPATFTATSFQDLNLTGVDLSTGKVSTGDITLRSAILAANFNAGTDTVVAPAGNYVLTIAGSQEDSGSTGDLDIRDDLTLDLTGATIDATGLVDRVLHIVLISPPAPTVVINNGTIQGGRIAFTGPVDAFGGGIFNAGSLTLNDVVIANNQAIGANAIVNGPGSAGGFGGGIASNGSLTINGGEIRDNRATGGNAAPGPGGGGSGSNASGGGLHHLSGALAVTSTRITGNSLQAGNGSDNGEAFAAATAFGGGVVIRNSSSATLTGVKIDNNTAVAGTGLDGILDGGRAFGGGLHVDGSDATVTNSTIESNMAQGGTGNAGKNISGGTGGDAFGGGVAFDPFAVTLTVENSTISGNRAIGGDGLPGSNGGGTRGQAFGGGIHLGGASGAAFIGSVTITDNEVLAGSGADVIVTEGGGLAGAGFIVSPSYHVRSSIIAGNRASKNPDVTITPAGSPQPFITNGSNLIGESDGTHGFTDGMNNDQVGTTAAPIDPLLTPLGFFGGDGLALVHALNIGSPARDAGDPGSNTTDHRGTGFTRVINGTADIGAFEVQIPTVIMAVVFEPVVEGQPFNVMATVTDPRFPPTGTVTLFIDGSPTGPPVALDSNGMATLVGVGPNTSPADISFEYSGDAAYLSGLSNTTTVTVLAPTATSVVAVLNPVFVTQGVTLNATVSKTATVGVFTGSVQFFVNASPFGSPIPVDGTTGAASFPVPAGFPVSTVSITADYLGDIGFGPSSAPPFTLVVNPIPTTTVVLANPNPVFATQAVTLSANVTPSIAGTPTGSVQFSVNGTPFGSPVTIDAAGNASLPVPAGFAVGSFAISAAYSGATNFTSSASVPVTLVVNPIPTATTVNVLPNPVFATQAVTLSANVTPSIAGTPTGSVQFSVNGTPFGSPVAIDASGNVTLPANNSLAVGSYTITAAYSGDARFVASTSSPVTLVVNPIPTATTVNALPNPVFANRTVTLSSTVTPGISGTPTGTVLFRVNGNPVGSSVAIDAFGNATLPVPSGFAPGSYTVTSTYSGDANFVTSASLPVTLIVNPIPTTTTVTVVPSSVLIGQFANLSANVTSSLSGTPTGTVQFLMNGTPFGSPIAIDAAGNASFPSFAPTVAGSSTFSAVYSGDTNFVTSAATPVTLVANQIPSTTAVNVSPNPAFTNQGLSLTASVSASTGTPTGSLTFLIDGRSVGTATLDSSGNATLPIPAGLAAGTYTLTANYTGTPVFLSSVSAPRILNVNPSPTTTQLAISPNSPSVGMPLTLTANVGATFGLPTGPVNFIVDGVTVGTGTLNSTGVATFSLPNGLTAGTYTFSASYPGISGVFLPSASSPITIVIPTVVNPSTTTVVASPNPVFATDPISLTANVASASGPIQSGTVNFFIDGQAVGTGSLNTSGIATLSLPNGLSFGDGNYDVTANFVGGATFSGSLSSVFVLNVRPVPTITTVTTAPNPATFGTAVTLTANVVFAPSTSPILGTRTAGLSPTILNGTVNFLNGTVSLGSAPVSNGVATLTTSTLPVGTNTITAVFIPATNDLLTSRGTASQVITAAVRPSREIFAVGSGFGIISKVKVYDADGTELREIEPFGPNFWCGVVVATADVTGDGVEDVIVGSALGGGPHVKVYDGVTFNLATEFFAFEQSFRGGISLAAGDLTGDGVAEIVTGAGVGGGPAVTIFSVTGGSIRVVNSFFAYDPTLRSGVSVAVSGGLLATGTGFTGGPQVNIFRGPGSTIVSSFFAFDSNSRMGVNVALGFDGTRTILIAATGAGRNPVVNTFDASTGTALAAGSMIYEPGYLGGVTATNVQTPSGMSRIVYGTGIGGGPRVRLFGPNNVLIRDFFAFDPEFRGGVFVG